MNKHRVAKVDARDKVTRIILKLIDATNRGKVLWSGGGTKYQTTVGLTELKVYNQSGGVMLCVDVSDVDFDIGDQSQQMMLKSLWVAVIEQRKRGDDGLTKLIELLDKL